MERATQRGSVALIVIGVILLLGGIAAFVLVAMDQVNYSEVGTAKKIGGAGCGVGAIALIAGIMARKNKS